MTKFRSSRWVLIACLVALAACTAPSGQRAERIAEPQIASAYVPLSLQAYWGLDSYAGAATVIAPGIAATNGHNSNLVPRNLVIGEVQDYDLLFFRIASSAAPPTAPPVIGSSVTAYGQGLEKDLRVAHGVVREIVTCPGCGLPNYFTYEGDAGPGFSGGPVVDAQGRLVGITFGYKDNGGKRLIYAYEMSRVQAELQAVQKAAR